MKRKNKKKLYRLTSAALITSTLSLGIASSALAGPPAIDTDEALYVNLDYYGQQTDLSIVKGCNLNGIRTFTDYGTYQHVVNMSNYAEPQMTEEGVSWKLPEDSKERFYYECELENGSIALPWDFDISYRLNGIPIEAQKLVGANGLVEIDVTCIPNSNASEYYKNNMLLQVGTMVNMEDVNSIQAPGSQTQSLGTYKVIIFAAVPGEEATFHMEIGTSNFESMGIIMMMMPGTLDQMKEIKDLKQMRDTVGDSSDELLDGMNEILDKLDQITNGMSATQSGLKELKQAKANLDRARDDIYWNADMGLDELEALSSKIGELAPDINNSQETLNQVSRDLNRMVDTLADSSDHFIGLSGEFGDLKENLEELRRRLKDSDLQDIGDLLDTINGQLAALDAVLGGLGGIVFLENDLPVDDEDIQDSIEELHDISGGLLDQLDGIISEEELEALKNQLNSMDAAAVTGNYSQLAEIAQSLRAAVSKARTVIGSLKEVFGNISTDNILADGQHVARRLEAIMSDVDSLISDIYSLNRTINENHDSFQEMLDHASETAGLLSGSTSSLVNVLRVVQQTSKSNREALENGTQKTLDGLIDVFEKATGNSASGRLKRANEDIKNSVKEELDKVEGETNLLNLDAEQEKISFTSSKNPAPSSIQIVLRTQEISQESINTNAVDIEPVVEDVGIWNRIINVLMKIWNGIMGIFH